jgi:hypothetical protein
MPTREDVATLMSELGPILDPLALEAFPEHGCWGIQLDEDKAILVEFNEDKSCLILSTEVGDFTGSPRQALHERLLIQNHQWRVTGGLCMALDAAEGQVVQWQEVQAEGLDITRLSAAVLEFAQRAATCKQDLQGFAPSGELQTGEMGILGQRV